MLLNPHSLPAVWLNPTDTVVKKAANTIDFVTLKYFMDGN